LKTESDDAEVMWDGSSYMQRLIGAKDELQTDRMSALAEKNAAVALLVLRVASAKAIDCD